MANLNPNNLTRSLIEATVAGSIIEIKDDPNRSIRKLVDLGKQFSHGRFRNELFSTIQSLLGNETSPYYQIMQNLLHHTKEASLQRIGVNIGYNSWTYGAKNIRMLEKRYPYNIPWSVVFQVEAQQGLFEIRNVNNIIGQGESMGIYTYFVMLKGSNDIMDRLISLCKSHLDSTFIIFISDNYRIEKDLEELADSTNILISFSSKEDSAVKRYQTLQKRKSPYGVFYEYNTGDDQKITEIMERSVQCESCFTFLIPDKQCDSETRNRMADLAYHYRMQPEYPTLMIEFYHDLEVIDRIISEDSCLLILESEILEADSNLQHILQQLQSEE